MLRRQIFDPERTISTWWSTRRFRRRFRQTTRFPIGELPEDAHGRVVGTVYAFGGDTLVAPLSERPCVYYVIEIEEIQGYGHPGRILATEQRGIPFVLAEGGAHAVVDPRSAQVSIALDRASSSKAAFDADHRQKELLLRHALVGRDWFQTERLEYREAAIEIGTELAIVGSGTREPDPDSSPTAYRSPTRTRLRLTSSTRHPLAITDDPRCR